MTTVRTTPRDIGSTLHTEHAPRRTCVGCRTTRAKSDLVRIAATPAGVRIDHDHVLPGRGAYVCPDPACIDHVERAKGHTLRRALRTSEQQHPAHGGITAVLSELHRQFDQEAGPSPDHESGPTPNDTAAPHEGTPPGGQTAPDGPADTRTSATKE